MQKFCDDKLDDSFLTSKIPIRIACLKPNGVPVVLSLWYEIVDGKIYCATQKTDKIVTYLEKNSLCGFEIAGDKPPYRGIRGEGSVKILSDKGKNILTVLIKKYLGEKESNLSNFLEKNSRTEVAIEIEPKKVVNYDYSKRMKGV